MAKQALRKEVLHHLKDQKQQEKERCDQQLLEKLLSTSAYKKAKVVATYLAFDHEFDTLPFIAQSQKDGKKVLVPKTYGQGRMIFVEYNPDDLKRSSYGLLEPKSDVAVDKSEIDLIHVPGVVFNEAGYRIGYGGGYYDRYLADFTGKTLSTIYGFQLAEFAPDKYDIAVDEVLNDQ